MALGFSPGSARIGPEYEQEAGPFSRVNLTSSSVKGIAVGISEITHENHLELYLCTVSAQESPVPCLPVPAISTMEGTSTHFPTQASFPNKHAFF